MERCMAVNGVIHQLFAPRFDSIRGSWAFEKERVSTDGLTTASRRNSSFLDKAVTFDAYIQTDCTITYAASTVFVKTLSQAR